MNTVRILQRPNATTNSFYEYGQDATTNSFYEYGQDAKTNECYNEQFL
jgi:hypothetical protein